LPVEAFDDSLGLIGDRAVSITTISSREFNQDAGGAKRAAEKGPVIITDRGRPSHVLLSIEEYRTLTGGGRSLLEQFAQKEEGDFDFDPPRMGDDISRAVDFD
jgi:prevent-host-death family protein